MNEAALSTRLVVFSYSLATYLVGMAAIAWLVLSLTGLLPLGTTAPAQTRSLTDAVLINLGLLMLFGLQHSIMARGGFKGWWTRFISPAAERSTYVFTSGLALGLLVWLWQPLGGVVWSVSQPLARMVLWLLFAFGWLYLVAATYVTNHYDLFGLRQGWLYLRGIPYTPVPFVRSWMYRYSRHPMMLGILVGMWVTPYMTLTHFMLAIGFTIYIMIGVAFEERDLMARFGEDYMRYRKQVGMVMPRLRS
jgi:protein-S-isoprenylcysteine O-methyltransferase Ste14